MTREKEYLPGKMTREKESYQLYYDVSIKWKQVNEKNKE